jgi:hypothetical protein
MNFLSQLFGTHRRSQAVADCLAGFPFEVEAVPGERALARLEELRTPDFTPVILGDGDGLRRRVALLARDPFTVADIQSRVRSIGTPEWWFTARTHALEECFEDVVGEWPAEYTPHDTVQAIYNRATGGPLPEVFITRLPIKDSWDAPVMLRFGGWDDSPFPEEHTAIARAWHEQYGAEIIAVTADTLEFAVSRPPATRDAAEELAMDQFAYCETLITHLTGSIRALAASLLNAPYWFFWWERSAAELAGD